MANDFTGPGDFTGCGIDALGAPANDRTEKAAAWIAPDENAPPGCGRVMLTRTGGAADQADPPVVLSGFPFLEKMFGVLAPDSPNVAGNIAIKSKSAANDNVVWVGNENEVGDGGGVYGSDVDAATLADGSSVVAWIGPDRVVHAKYHPADGDGHGASAEETAARAEHVGQINELLGDLGGAGQRAGNADGRVKVSPYGQGGVAALWIADFGFMAALMGKVYMLQQESGGDSSVDRQSAQSALWTVKDIAPVAVPKFASNISIDVSDDGRISVSYLSEPGDSGSMFAVTVASGDAGRDEMVGSDEGDLLAPEAESSDLQVPHGSSAPVKVGNTDTSQVDETDVADAVTAGGETNVPADDGSAPDGNSNGGSLGSAVPDNTTDIELIGTPVTVAGGEGDTVAQKKPQVVAQGDKIAVLHVSDGEKPGTSIIQVDLIDGNGKPVIGADGAPASVVVASDAIVEDPDKPFLELDPSMSFAGNNVVVAYVSNSIDGEQTRYQLNLQLIDDDGKLASGSTTVVALASESETTYSDFDTAGLTTHHHDEGAGPSDSGNSDQAGPYDGAGSIAGDAVNSEPQSPVGAQVAVVWVENANESGYGSIMGQLFAIVDRESEVQGSNDGGNNSGPGNAADSGHVLVALGLDGSVDSSGGNGDAAFQMPSETAEDVIGRAPQVTGCGNDKMAVAWVQESSPGSGVEVVAGAVMQSSGGNSLLAIDLTGLIGNGILRGTEPSLLSDDNGDIVIGWMQSNSSGLYEAAVAVYRAIETGGWTVPDIAIVLRTFDTAPANLDFGLQGGDNPTILLSWSGDHGRVTGVYFDLDGNQDGSVFRIRGGDNNAAEGDVSVAGLSNGHIVVVYTQTDGADTDIGAMIVQTAPSSGGGGDNSGSGSGSSEQNLDSGSTQVAIIVTTPSQPEIGPADTGSDADATTSLVVVDLESDLIRVYGSAVSDASGSTSSMIGSSSNSGSGSSTSGSSSGGDDGSLNYAVNNDSTFDISGSGASGSGSSAGGSGNDSGDTLAFAFGYGNDAADYHEDEHVFDVTEPITDMFDALQFANALSDNGNGEVIVFEASNLVVIRDFETL